MEISLGGTAENSLFVHVGPVNSLKKMSVIRQVTVTVSSQTETEPFQAMLCNSKTCIEVGELVFSASLT